MYVDFTGPIRRRIGSRLFLEGFAAPRQEACGRTDVDVGDEQPFLTVWLVSEQDSIGPHHRRCRRRPGACTIYRCKIAGVLGSPTQHCLFVKRVRGVCKIRRYVTASLGDMKMGMKHDLCAPSCGPADGFWIASTLMANHYPKCQGTCLKDLPPNAMRIRTFLRGVELNFVLKTSEASVGIDY